MLTNEQWIIVTIGHQDIALFVHFTLNNQLHCTPILFVSI
jgi:hypothetical protein